MSAASIVGNEAPEETVDGFVVVEEASDGAVAVVMAPDLVVDVDGAPPIGNSAARVARPRKKYWVWWGTCRATDTASIIKLRISVDRLHKDLRICLEGKPGGVLSMEL
jgi:hypothetical protein